MITEVVARFLEFRNQIKMYHWKTPTYSKHKASDDFLKNIDDLIDRFIETMSGSRGERPVEIEGLVFKNLTDKSIVGYLESFKSWVVYELPGLLYEHETDLLNLKDELLGIVNQGIYLLSMK